MTVDELKHKIHDLFMLLEGEVSKYNVRLIPSQIRSIATRGGLRVSSPGDFIIVNNE